MNRLLILAGLIIFSVVDVAGAQEKVGSFRDRPDRDIITTRIIEEDDTTYVREQETILRQLKIITGDEETRYIIVPGDTLKISFRDRDQVNEAVYQVSGSGEIYLPLAGAVKVGGFNRKQAREKINMILQEYIRYPNAEIHVNVEGRYIVAGEVESPGVFRIRPNLTMMEAIVGAQYDKNDGRLNSVILVRGSPDKPVVARLDLLKLIRHGDKTDNIAVKPGDFIYVPKSWIANIEKFIGTVYRYVKAYYGFGRIPGEPEATGGEPDQIFWE